MPYTIVPPTSPTAGAQPDKYTIAPPDPPESGLEAFWHGLEQGGGDVLVGGRQLVALAGLGDEAALTKSASEREAAYSSSPGVQQHPYLSAAGRLGGNVLTTLPLDIGGPEILGAGLAARLGAGALRGAAGGALMPKTSGDTLGETMRQAATGGAAGGALTGLGSALGGAMAPRLAPDAATLAKQGVVLTPGQMVQRGDFSRDIEERAASLPLLRTFINEKRARSVDTFDLATINQALAPIGVSISGKTAGHDAVKLMGDTISDAYKHVLSRIPHLDFTDPDLVSEFRRVTADAQQRPAVWQNVEGVMNDLLVNKLKAARPMTGNEVQKWTSDLWRQAKQLSKSDDFFHREEGRLLGEYRSALLDAVTRQHPNAGPDLERANAAWAMGVRIEDAAGRRAAGEGRFTPMDLLSASRSSASGVRKRQFSRGDAILQQWAETGQRVLPNTLGESGTTPRSHLLNPLAWAAGILGRPIYGALASEGRAQPGAVRRALGETARGLAYGAPGFGAYSATMDRAAQPLPPQP